jgi:zinc protease
MVAYHVPAAHEDMAALDVLCGVLSGGGRGGNSASGRLYKALVDNKKAISARMSARSMHDPGLAIATVDLNKDQSLAEARRILIATIEGLAAEPPTREEVERVKTRLAAAEEREMANSQSVGLGLSEWAALGDWRLMFLERDRVKKVTPEDVARVAKKYFIESNRTVGEFIPTDKPVRAEVPATPNLTALLKDFKGGAGIAQGESFDPTPANIESRLIRTKLPNGMKVVILPRKMRGGTVSALLDLRFGDEKSLAGKSAVAQIAGGLLMRGTRTRSRQQIQDEIDRLQARIFVSGGGGGGTTGSGRRGGTTDSTGVADASASIETKAENLVAALKLAVEMLREPSFPETDFDQVKQQRIAAVESGRAEPTALALQELTRHLSPFTAGDARYVASIDEQIANLKKVTLDDVKKFHAQFYGADAGELIVSGDFDQAALRKAAAELLGDWKSGTPYQRMATPFKAAAAVKREIRTPDKQNAMFEAGLRFRMSEDDPDYPAMLLANQMFGGSLGARMPNRIRNQEGLSYSVASRVSVPLMGDGALFSAAAISAPQNTAKVESSFKDELQKTLKEGFTAAEVATAKKAFHDQQMVYRSQESTLLRLIMTRDQTGRTMKWDEQLEAKVQALTPEQINQAFRKHLDPAALSIVEAGDFK